MTSALNTARVARSQYKTQLSRIRKDVLAEDIMSAVTGLVAVLNDQREVLTVNQPLMEALGIANPAQVLGLRIGEAVGCVHASECTQKCGSTEFCRTCGTSLAIATAVAQNTASDQTCALQVMRNGKRVDLFYLVRCTPVSVSGRRFYLLCFEDKTEAQKSAALQRIFFQDLNNLVASLSARPSERKPRNLTVDSWTAESYAPTVALDRQLSLHKYMAGEGKFAPVQEQISLKRIFEELKKRFEKHPAAKGKKFSLPPASLDFTFVSDSVVLIEALSALVTNALEATSKAGQIRLSASSGADSVTFEVWNRGSIPPAVARRVFQRNFSTKQEFGRGLGTYFCKKLSEELLGGKVGFKSSKSGTVFEIELGPPTN